MQVVVDTHASALIRTFISQRRVPDFVLAARASSRSQNSSSSSAESSSIPLLSDPRQLDQLLEEAAFICREVELFDGSLRTAARDAWIALKRSSQSLDSLQASSEVTQPSAIRTRLLQLVSDFSHDTTYGFELKRSNVSAANMVMNCQNELDDT